MRCQDCGGRCYGYDGGPAADYQYWVQVCSECGCWQDDDGWFDDDDEYDDEPEEP